MKVLLINGSPHMNGCTFTALSEVKGALEANGAEADIKWIGVKPLAGCIACGSCNRLGGHCCFRDSVNDFIDVLDDYDGYVFGTPVHYAAMGGSMTCFMDRLFYAAGSRMAGKPAAGVMSARRGGTTATYDQLNKYFGINNMMIVGSQYWNQVHGNSPDEVRQDLEGLQTMRTLGSNMAWLLKCIEAGKAQGIVFPGAEQPRQRTNFIR